ncbi:MAG: hypothetical protein HY717_11905 [Planctomycetes bacterium]|nr:hypothetical protein [Planctomycetota bacterium]
MDAPFPFGFPFSTGLYLTLYLLTWVFHVLFMNYLLAGSFYVFGVYLSRALRPAALAASRQGQAAERILVDWLPFALSAAITAGVAPLLFLQILYPRRFYTANLLLFHRWMAILPALIAGFYLLYLLKSRWMERRSRFIRTAASLGALLCFAFTGWSWTENHLLSLDEPAWPAFYASRSLIYRSTEVLPRFALWTAGSFPTLAALLLWQFRFGGNSVEVTARDWRRLAEMALAGLALSLLAGGAYVAVMERPARERLIGSMALPYAVAALAGLAMQAAGWIFQRRRDTSSQCCLVLISSGLLLSLLGIAVLREAVRLSAIDIQAFYPAHEQAAGEGGLLVFLFFFTINAILIAGCFILARRCSTDGARSG